MTITILLNLIVLDIHRPGGSFRHRPFSEKHVRIRNLENKIYLKLAGH